MALDEIDGVLADETEVGLQLDPLGHHLGAEPMAELGKEGEDAAGLFPAPCLADDLEVDLDFSDRQVGKLPEAAIALADVIKGKTEAGQPELGKHPERLGGVIVETILDQFEVDLLG